MRTFAIAGALLAAHIALGLAVHEQPALGVDRDAFDLMRDLRTTTMVDIVRVFTNVASLPVTALAILATAFFAHRAGRTGQAVALIVGMILTVALVGLTKQLWDRPRPPHRLSSAQGLSFPSGHAAYATAWLAAATTTGRRPLVIAGAGLLITVGASRLYLHVHYLTDVLGGAALAGAIFVGCLNRR